MRPAHARLLVCPVCHGSLDLQVAMMDGERVLEGALTCPRCTARFPVVNGIPRFARLEGGTDALTAEAFGYQWRRFSEDSPLVGVEFRDYIDPIHPEDLEGLTVLDAGCGNGRFTRLAALSGAKLVVAADLSPQCVEVTRDRTADLPNVFVVQADLTRLPFARCFDFAFSLGVIHHLSVPLRGVSGVTQTVVPGGRFLVWVYGAEGGAPLIQILEWLRTRVARRLPHPVLRAAAWVGGAGFWLLAWTLYRPARRLTPSVFRLLPLGEYVVFQSGLGFRYLWLTVFDKLVAPLVVYPRRDELATWFSQAGAGQLSITSRRGYSWKALFELASAPQEGCVQAGGSDKVR